MSQLMKQPPSRLSVNDSMDVVLKVFDSTHSWVLPVENNEGEFVGFIRKSTVLAAYRQVLADFSSD